MSVWGAWAWGFQVPRAPRFFLCAARGDAVRVLSASARGWGAAAGSLLCASFVLVRSARACLVSLSDSLCGLLTRFRALGLPRVRFASVWSSTGRTVRLVGLWRFLCCGCGAFACGVGFFVGARMSASGRVWSGRSFFLLCSSRAWCALSAVSFMLSCLMVRSGYSAFQL